MANESVVVIGGGIAGFSVARELSRHGAAVTLLEQEPLAFSHSSSRNAAIYRPLEESRIITKLTRRTRELYDELGPQLLRRHGLVLFASAQSSLEQLENTARAEGVNFERLEGESLYSAAPALLDGHGRYGLLLPNAGTLDTHSLCEAVRASACANGVAVHTRQTVTGLLTRRTRVLGVETPTQRHTASRVVLAGGAWASQLAARWGCALNLLPYRRHLAQLEGQTLSQAHPVCWNVETGVYFRRESSGILACPGDHVAHVPCLPAVDESQVYNLAKRLPKEAPCLANVGLRRAWACLRTMSSDGHMVLGEDPRLRGFFWFAALAGHGMSAGLAAAEILARSILDNKALPTQLDVSRLFAMPTKRALSANA